MAHIEVVEDDKNGNGCEGCVFEDMACSPVRTYLKKEHGLQGCGTSHVTYRLHGCTLEELTDALEDYYAHKQKV